MLCSGLKRRPDTSNLGDSLAISNDILLGLGVFCLLSIEIKTPSLTELGYSALIVSSSASETYKTGGSLLFF